MTQKSYGLVRQMGRPVYPGDLFTGPDDQRWTLSGIVASKRKVLVIPPGEKSYVERVPERVGLTMESLS